MIIRRLTELVEFDKCVDLQREIWGWSDLDLLPAKFFVVATHIGGLALGAFDGKRMGGFALAIPGVRDGIPYWRSQMTGVAKDCHNSGIGAELKFAQRDYAREQGIHLIDWTFDPLESRNAHFNIQKLGVIVRQYEVNHYGVTSATLQQGLESDRVVAEWWIDKPRVDVEGGDIRRVYIPSDIQMLKKQSLKSAQDVQLRVREQFLKYLQEDYFVAGFERKDEWSEYLFLPGASRVHQAD